MAYKVQFIRDTIEEQEMQERACKVADFLENMKVKNIEGFRDDEITAHSAGNLAEMLTAYENCVSDIVDEYGLDWGDEMVGTKEQTEEAVNG